MSQAEPLRELESRLNDRRLVELAISPVAGNFDAAHLKEVHRRIFQDLPAHGITNPSPGVFRDSVPEGHDWHKNRLLESIGERGIASPSRGCKPEPLGG
jgi:cell filamentation protein